MFAESWAAKPAVTDRVFDAADIGDREFPVPFHQRGTDKVGGTRMNAKAVRRDHCSVSCVGPERPVGMIWKLQLNSETGAGRSAHRHPSRV